MTPDQFTTASSGKCQKTLEGYFAYIPAALPPNLLLDWKLIRFFR